MEYRVRINLLGTAAVITAGIALSVITSAVVASRALDTHGKRQADRSREIVVKGSARSRVRSDTGVWRITVHGDGKEIKEAFEVLDAGVSAVKRFLDAQGFPGAEVALAAVDTTVLHSLDTNGKPTPDIAGYAMERTFTVTTQQVERVSSAAGEVTQLLRDGVNVASSAPQFYYSRIADLKVQMLGDASKDARLRADQIVLNSGGAVGRVRDARMSPLQITRPNSTDVTSEGIYDTSTIDKDVVAVVTVTYGLEDEGR